MFGGRSTIVDVQLSGVSATSITTNTKDQLVVVVDQAASNNICDVVCHGSCEDCSADGV